MENIPYYQKAFNDFLQDFNIEKKPQSLYQPIKYILSIGGKRLRPVLALMAAETFGGSYKSALNAALCVEVFHNFTLMHDDIMDQAELRRGEVPVHIKWDLNTGILSGDAMLILAYQHLENYDQEIFKKLMQVFNKTALEVCEGQQMDIDFETRDAVSIEEYLKMIEYKTAVLVGASMKMGAIAASANSDDQELIYQFGKNLGIAFQLQDDYLDAFGNPEDFGKTKGGDIIENKKTILYLRTLQIANREDKSTLEKLYSEKQGDKDSKVNTVMELFSKYRIRELIKKDIEHFTQKAYGSLERVSAPEKHKAILRELAHGLMTRTI